MTTDARSALLAFLQSEAPKAHSADDLAALLGLDRAASDRLRAAILSGAEVEKPGFVRLNLCWLAPETEVRFILDAVEDVAARAPALAARYACDESRAIFSPAA